MKNVDRLSHLHFRITSSFFNIGIFSVLNGSKIHNNISSFAICLGNIIFISVPTSGNTFFIHLRPALAPMVRNSA